MCGIAGVMTGNRQESPAEPMRRMARALGHRGPDGEGRYLAPGMALLQTRLAIIDLETGDQPLFEPGGSALVANGEIYNYIELRRDMAETGFATKSDCEPALFLYARNGITFPDRLRGMYGMAIFDPAEERLVLARDPFGIKPLYYVEGPHGFAFASEPQALIAAGLVEPKLRRQAALELMQLQFTTGRHTIFQGIDRVLPGETLCVVNGRIVERRRQSALPRPEIRATTEEEALSALDRLLMESVMLHQRSDVPYGMFLSGGIDSSSILACMARLSSEPVRCYTAGFPGTDETDERAHAARVAKAVGAAHVDVGVTANDFWTLLPEIAAATDDPIADYAIIPTYRLGQEAAKDLKVVLSGEGGDELFAGYGRYRGVMRPFMLGGRTLRARGTFDGLGVLREEGANWRDGIRAAEGMLSEGRGTRVQVAQAVDCADWLPHDLLIKLDRCLMAHGLEGRTPFLDSSLARFAYCLPDDLKIRRSQGKYLLRRWLDKALPEADAFSTKRGFSVPVGAWIGERASQVGPYVAASPGVQELCRPDAVMRLFKSVDGSARKRTARAAWTLLFYALWHRRHIQGMKPHGGVLDTLSQAA